MRVRGTESRHPFGGITDIVGKYSSTTRMRKVIKQKMSDHNSVEKQDGRKNDVQYSAHIMREGVPNNSNNSSTIPYRPRARARYRTRADIICAILKVAAGGGAIKTRITSQAYVSSPQIKDYMNFLLQNDMLQYNSESRKYHTTEKGQRLLRMYDEAKVIFNPR